MMMVMMMMMMMIMMMMMMMMMMIMMMMIMIMMMIIITVILQVTLTTIIITECQVPFFTELTLTPTIPVRPNNAGNYLFVTFYLPAGLWLKNKEKCFVELKQITPVKVGVGADCGLLRASTKY